MWKNQLEFFYYIIVIGTLQNFDEYRLTECSTRIFFVDVYYAKLIDGKNWILIGMEHTRKHIV